MIEVLATNFSDHCDEFQRKLKNCKFVAIDTEFTALSLSKENKPSLFDTPEQRYKKLRHTVQDTIPIQIGVSLFIFDTDKNTYTADTYLFYLWPKPFFTIDHSLSFQASSFLFLSQHEFDYNKAIYNGLPFINSAQEKQISDDLKTRNYPDIIPDHIELDSATKEAATFFRNASYGDQSVLETLSKKQMKSQNADIIYLVQYYMRKPYEKELWTFIKDDCMYIRKVTKDEYKEMDKKHPLEETMIKKALGFTWIYRFLKEAKKPIVGHNLLTDLMHFYNSFDDPLPKSYPQFKKSIQEAFPVIFDTKSISFGARKLIERQKQWQSGKLSEMYKYFKDLDGRHLAFKSPLIRMSTECETDHFHNAGFDSYVTGYIFVRMAHFLASKQFVTSNRTITSTEHLAAVDEYRNHINMIRGASSFINLAGEDPKSTRPPLLVAQSNCKLDLCLVNAILSEYGYIETKSITKKSALIAVDNYTNYKRILRSFPSRNEEISIEMYRYIKHGAYRKHFLLTGGLLVFLAMFGALKSK